LLPGNVNCRVPVLANGWPDIGVEDPFVGSNHLALAFAFRLAMFTVIVRAVGM
jgi:hypothetical protein